MQHGAARILGGTDKAKSITVDTAWIQENPRSAPTLTIQSCLAWIPRVFGFTIEGYGSYNFKFTLTQERQGIIQGAALCYLPLSWETHMKMKPLSNLTFTQCWFV